MSEIRMFSLGTRTKNGSVIGALVIRRSDFGHSGGSVLLIIRLYYKHSKSERSVGPVDQPYI